MAEDQQYTEYKVIYVVEGGCGTIILGSSGIPVKKMETELNTLASSGWKVVFRRSENWLIKLFLNDSFSSKVLRRNVDHGGFGHQGSQPHIVSDGPLGLVANCSILCA